MKSIGLRHKPVQDQAWREALLAAEAVQAGNGASAAVAAALRAERDRLLEERDQLRAEREALLAMCHQACQGNKTPSPGARSGTQELQASFQALEKKHNHYANLYDFAPVGYVILEAGGRIADINKAGAMLLGWEHARLQGRPFADFVAAGDQPKFLKHLQQCQNGASRINSELSLCCKDGARLPVQLVSAGFASLDEQVIQYRTAIIDITQRRRVEEGLQQLQQDYRTLVNALDGIVWEATAGEQGWSFTFVSNQAERLFGYPAQRWVQKQGWWLELVHANDRARVLEARARALESGEHYLMEYRMIAANGQVLWLRDNVSATRLASGKYKLQGVTVNITELKEADVAMRNVYQELEQRILQRTGVLTRTCRELQQSLAERQRLENEILELAERERRRIGLDLHDELGQRLTGLSLMVKSLHVRLGKKGLAEAAHAAEIHQMVAQTIRQAHDLSHGLAGLEVEDQPLPAALVTLARRAESLFGVHCQVRVSAAVPAHDANTVRHLCKIAQEAVTNAFKHGRAKKIMVRLAVVERALRLTVSNDGLPFPKLLQSQDGLGLRTMRYRAKIIGAAFEVRAKGRRGTVVSCCLPLAPASSG